MSLLDEQSKLEADAAAEAVLYSPFYASKIFVDGCLTNKYLTIGDMLNIEGAFKGHRIASKIAMVRGVKQKLNIDLKEAKRVVDFFVEEFCTKVNIMIDQINPNSLCCVTFLKGELCGTKVYDFQSEVKSFKLQCSDRYLA